MTVGGGLGLRQKQKGLAEASANTTLSVESGRVLPTAQNNAATVTSSKGGDVKV